MTSLRQSSLDDEKVKLLGERIKLVIQNITHEIKGSRDFNLAGRLESAYEEIRRLVEDLSDRDEQ